ncbi:ArnT family glycosyltransferase [Desulfitobacterium sp. Sab5]|uniref:ArnT family glycosyltransferase n=1 Tax=Desulfitobacterium nosdiversum TaxID=3375356 RepID=UPI003CF93ED1
MGLILGFLTGLIWIIGVPTRPFSDFLYYHELAQQIASGGVWGDTYTSVGYPIFLSIFYRAFGYSLFISKFVNLCLSLIMNLLAFRLLYILVKVKRLQMAAWISFVLFPVNIYYNGIIANEILFTTLLLLCINLYFSKIKYRYFLIGVITGINSLIKPFFPAFFGVVLLMELLVERKWRSALKNSGIILGMCILVITPWLFRNYLMMGEFTYISNNGGIVLYINNNSQNRNGSWMPATEVENTVVNRPEYILANATEKNKMLSQAAKQWIIHHPVDFMVLGLKRIGNTYLGLADIKNSFNGSQLPLWVRTLLGIGVDLIRIPFYWIGFGSICGFSFYYLTKFQFRSFKQHYLNREELFLLLVFWMFTGIYFITEGQARYAFPLNFVIIYFAIKGSSLVRDMLIQSPKIT